SSCRSRRTSRSSWSGTASGSRASVRRRWGSGGSARWAASTARRATPRGCAARGRTAPASSLCCPPRRRVSSERPGWRLARVGLRSSLLLGIDVGTSSCKAAVVDAASGAELVHGSAATPWIRVPSGAEADADALFAAAASAAREALERAPAGELAGIGVASMAETGVLLDGAGEVLAPSIAWHDARGEGEAAAIATDLGRAAFEERSGLPATPLCTLAKLRWLLGHHEPARRARRWLNVSEWIVRRLGGRDVSELSLASRTGMLDLAEGAPYAEALASSALPDDLLGEIVVAGTACGVTGGEALPGAKGAVLTVAGHD